MEAIDVTGWPAEMFARWATAKGPYEVAMYYCGHLAKDRDEARMKRRRTLPDDLKRDLKRAEQAQVIGTPKGCLVQRRLDEDVCEYLFQRSAA